MKNRILGLFTVVGALGFAVLLMAQSQFPPTLPANSVYGRLGISPGPAQAIPFATLGQHFLPTLQQNRIYVGNSTNAATAVPMAGDCSIVSAGTITCTKTNGTNLGTMATQNSSGVSITGGTITGLGTPSGSSDAAPKSYVDSVAVGLRPQTAVKLATIAVLSNTPTYANGASGVGATLTAGSNGALTVDGVAVTNGDRVLVKNQASGLQNGCYTQTTLGDGSTPYVLTRCTDFDTAAEMLAGSSFAVQAGTLIGSIWALQSTVTTVGSTTATFVQFAVPTGSQWITTGSDLYYSLGKVMIGLASSPTYSLQVHQPTAATAAVVHITNASAGSTSTDGGMIIVTGNANADMYVQNNENGNISLVTNGATRFGVSPAGLTNVIGSFGVNGNYTSGSDITSALNTDLAAYSYIKLPCGTFTISGTALTMGLAGQTLAGSGDCTVLKNSYNGSTYQGLITATTKDRVTVRDLIIDMDSKGSSSFCINFQESADTKIINVTCKNALNGGFTLAQNGGGSTGSDRGLISNCNMANIANVAATNAHAIELSISHNVVITNCRMNNVDNGINVAASNSVSISGVSITGSGLTNSGFAGIRCADNANYLAASAATMRDIPRGLFLVGCNNSSFSGISILNAQYEPILIDASNVPGAPTSAPTQGNSISGVTIQNGCLASSCSGAIVFAVSGVAANQVTNNIVTGANIIISSGSVSQAFQLVGVTGGLNKCDSNNNMANVTFGSC